MRNPNKTNTSVKNFTDRTVITFQYTSASMVRYDLPSVRQSYPTATIFADEKLHNISVTIWKKASDEAIDRPFKSESF